MEKQEETMVKHSYVGCSHTTLVVGKSGLQRRSSSRMLLWDFCVQ